MMRAHALPPKYDVTSSKMPQGQKQPRTWNREELTQRIQSIDSFTRHEAETQVDVLLMSIYGTE